MISRWVYHSETSPRSRRGRRMGRRLSVGRRPVVGCLLACLCRSIWSIKRKSSAKKMRQKVSQIPSLYFIERVSIKLLTQGHQSRLRLKCKSGLSLDGEFRCSKSRESKFISRRLNQRPRWRWNEVREVRSRGGGEREWKCRLKISTRKKEKKDEGGIKRVPSFTPTDRHIDRRSASVSRTADN